MPLEGDHMAMKYSLVAYSFGKERLETGVERLKKLGYDGIEVPCITSISPAKAREFIEGHGLVASFVTGIWGGAFAPSPRDLLGDEESLRKAGLDYVRACVDMAYALNAKSTMVCFAAWKPPNPQTSKEKLWKLAVQELKTVDGYARDRGITLCVEPLNRYEAHLIQTINEADKLIDDIGSDNFAILGDTYAMHLEEVSVADAIRRSKRIQHMHLVDSNRLAPGLGSVDFRNVIKVLKEKGYTGFGSVEFMRPYPNNDTAAKVALQYLKATEAVLDIAESGSYGA